jgi:hypothetical protein
MLLLLLQCRSVESASFYQSFEAVTVRAANLSTGSFLRSIRIGSDVRGLNTVDTGTLSLLVWKSSDGVQLGEDVSYGGAPALRTSPLQAVRGTVVLGSAGGTSEAFAATAIRDTELDFGSWEAATIAFSSRLSSSARGLVFCVTDDLVVGGTRRFVLAAELLRAAERGHPWTSFAFPVYGAVYVDGPARTLSFMQRPPGSWLLTWEVFHLNADVLDSLDFFDGEWHLVAFTLQPHKDKNTILQLYIDGKSNEGDYSFRRCIASLALGELISAAPLAQVVTDAAAFFAAEGGVSAEPGGILVMGVGASSAGPHELYNLQFFPQAMTRLQIVQLGSQALIQNIPISKSFALSAALGLIVVSAVFFAFVLSHAAMELTGYNLWSRLVNSLKFLGGAGPEGIKSDTHALGKAGSNFAAVASAGHSVGSTVSQITAQSAVRMSGAASSVLSPLRQVLVIVPQCLSVLQGMALYMRMWNWPPSFREFMTKLSIAVAFDFTFPDIAIPAYVTFVAQFSLCAILLGKILFDIKSDRCIFSSVVQNFQLSMAIASCHVSEVLDAVLLENKILDIDSKTHWRMSKAIAGCGYDSSRFVAIIAEARSQQAKGVEDTLATAIALKLQEHPIPLAPMEALINLFAFKEGIQLPRNALPQIAVQMKDLSNDAAIIRAVESHMSSEMLPSSRLVLMQMIREYKLNRPKLLQWTQAGDESVDYFTFTQFVQTTVDDDHDYSRNSLAEKPQAQKSLLSGEASAVYVVTLQECNVVDAKRLRLLFGSEALFPRLTLDISSSVAQLYQQHFLRQADAFVRNTSLDTVSVGDVLCRCGPSHVTLSNCFLERCGLEVVLAANNPLFLGGDALSAPAGDSSGRQMPRTSQIRFLVDVQCPTKMMCPVHNRSLIPAMEEQHFLERNRDGSFPYKCVHTRSNLFHLNALTAQKAREEGLSRGMLTDDDEDGVEVEPCVEDEVFVCPLSMSSGSPCRYTVCGLCCSTRTPLTVVDHIDSLFAAVGTRVDRMTLRMLLFLAIQALLFPVTQNCMMILACNPIYQCEFPHCYNPPSQGFLAAVAFACLVLVGFRLLVVVLWTVELSRRKKVLNALIDDSECMWTWFLAMDSSILSALYRKYEFLYMEVDPSLQLIFQVALSAASAFTQKETRPQVLSLAVVEGLNCAFLSVSNLYADPWMDILAKVGSIHQIVQMALLSNHRALALDDPNTNVMSPVMIGVAGAYFIFVFLVTRHTVYVPWRRSTAAVVAAGFSRREQRHLMYDDRRRTEKNLLKVLAEKELYYGKHHLQCLVTQALITRNKLQMMEAESSEKELHPSSVVDVVYASCRGVVSTGPQLRQILIGETEENSSSKWCASEGGPWVLSFTFDTPRTIVGYQLRSAGDSPDKDPVSWTVRDIKSGAVLDEQLLVDPQWRRWGPKKFMFFQYCVTEGLEIEIHDTQFHEACQLGQVRFLVNETRRSIDDAKAAFFDILLETLEQLPDVLDDHDHLNGQPLLPHARTAICELITVGPRHLPVFNDVMLTLRKIVASSAPQSNQQPSVTGMAAANCIGLMAASGVTMCNGLRTESITKFSFSGAFLAGAELPGTSFEKGSFAGANLCQANLNRCFFRGVDFTGAVWVNAKFENVADGAAARPELSIDPPKLCVIAFCVCSISRDDNCLAVVCADDPAVHFACISGDPSGSPVCTWLPGTLPHGHTERILGIERTSLSYVTWDSHTIRFWKTLSPAQKGRAQVFECEKSHAYRSVVPIAFASSLFGVLCEADLAAVRIYACTNEEGTVNDECVRFSADVQHFVCAGDSGLAAVLDDGFIEIRDRATNSVTLRVAPIAAWRGVPCSGMSMVGESQIICGFGRRAVAIILSSAGSTSENERSVPEQALSQILVGDLEDEIAFVSCPQGLGAMIVTVSGTILMQEDECSVGLQENEGEECNVEGYIPWALGCFSTQTVELRQIPKAVDHLPEHGVVVLGADGRVELVRDQNMPKIEVPPREPQGLCINITGSLVAAFSGCSIAVSHTSTEESRYLLGLEDSVVCASFYPPSPTCLAVFTRDGMLTWYDVDSSTPRLKRIPVASFLPSCPEPHARTLVTSCSFRPDGTMAVLGTATQGLSVFRACCSTEASEGGSSTPTPTLLLVWQNRSILFAELSGFFPNGEWVVGFHSRVAVSPDRASFTLGFFIAESGEQDFSAHLRVNTPSHLVFSPDGTMFAVGEIGCVRFYKLDVVEHRKASIPLLAPGGGGGDSKVSRWKSVQRKVETLTPFHEILQLRTPVDNIAFAPGLSHVVAGSFHGRQLRLLLLDTKTTRAVGDHQSGMVKSIFTADGSRLIGISLTEKRIVGQNVNLSEIPPTIPPDGIFLNFQRASRKAKQLPKPAGQVEETEVVAFDAEFDKTEESSDATVSAQLQLPTEYPKFVTGASLCRPFGRYFVLCGHNDATVWDILTCRFVRRVRLGGHRKQCSVSALGLDVADPYRPDLTHRLLISIVETERSDTIIVIDNALAAAAHINRKTLPARIVFHDIAVSPVMCVTVLVSGDVFGFDPRTGVPKFSMDVRGLGLRPARRYEEVLVPVTNITVTLATGDVRGKDYKENMLDDSEDARSCWGTTSPGPWEVHFQFKAPVKLVGYQLRSAEGNPQCDPKSWTLCDNAGYEMHAASNEAFRDRWELRPFRLSNPFVCSECRLCISATMSDTSAGGCQIGQIQFVIQPEAGFDDFVTAACLVGHDMQYVFPAVTSDPPLLCLTDGASIVLREMDEVESSAAWPDIAADSCLSCGSSASSMVIGGLRGCSHAPLLLVAPLCGEFSILRLSRTTKSWSHVANTRCTADRVFGVPRFVLPAAKMLEDNLRVSIAVADISGDHPVARVLVLLDEEEQREVDKRREMLPFGSACMLQGTMPSSMTILAAASGTHMLLVDSCQPCVRKTAAADALFMDLGELCSGVGCNPVLSSSGIFSRALVGGCGFARFGLPLVSKLRAGQGAAAPLSVLHRPLLLGESLVSLQTDRHVVEGCVPTWELSSHGKITRVELGVVAVSCEGKPSPDAGRPIWNLVSFHVVHANKPSERVVASLIALSGTRQKVDGDDSFDILIVVTDVTGHTAALDEGNCGLAEHCEVKFRAGGHCPSEQILRACLSDNGSTLVAFINATMLVVLVEEKRIVKAVDIFEFLARTDMSSSARRMSASVNRAATINKAAFNIKDYSLPLAVSADGSMTSFSLNAVPLSVSTNRRKTNCFVIPLTEEGEEMWAEDVGYVHLEDDRQRSSELPPELFPPSPHSSLTKPIECDAAPATNKKMHSDPGGSAAPGWAIHPFEEMHFVPHRSRTHAVTSALTTLSLVQFRAPLRHQLVSSWTAPDPITHTALYMSSTKVAVDKDAMPVRVAAATNSNIFLLSLHSVTKCMIIELITPIRHSTALRFMEVPVTLEQPQPRYGTEKRKMEGRNECKTETHGALFSQLRASDEASISFIAHQGEERADSLAAAVPQKPVMAVNLYETGARVAVIDIVQAEPTTYNLRNPNFFSNCTPEEVVRAIRYPEL